MNLVGIAYVLANRAGKSIRQKTVEHLHPEEKEKREKEEYLKKVQEETKLKKQREKEIQDEKTGRVYKVWFWVILFIVFLFYDLCAFNEMFFESLWEVDGVKKGYHYMNSNHAFEPINFWLNILLVFITYMIFRRMIKSISRARDK